MNSTTMVAALFSTDAIIAWIPKITLQLRRKGLASGRQVGLTRLLKCNKTATQKLYAPTVPLRDVVYTAHSRDVFSYALLLRA